MNATQTGIETLLRNGTPTESIQRILTKLAAEHYQSRLQAGDSEEVAAAASGKVFWSTFEADFVGTVGNLVVNFECVGGVRLRFEGSHLSSTPLGKVYGTGPGLFVVDPTTLGGRTSGYGILLTPSLFLVGASMTWADGLQAIGNLTGVGAGLSAGPALGNGKFIRV